MEFDHYISCSNNKVINVLDIVIKAGNIDFIMEELKNLFVIETGENTYIFSNYELIECYKVDKDLIQITCIK